MKLLKNGGISMIRKLVEADRAQTLAFLSVEPAINLFMIGDIEQDGFDKDFQEFWGDFNNLGELEGVLVRYNEFYIPYYKVLDFNPLPFVEIIKSDLKHVGISGKESILNLFKPYFNTYHCKSTYFCELKTADKLKALSLPIKVAIPEDASRICELLNEIEEFSESPSKPESLERIIRSGAGRVYYTETEDGILKNVVQTTAENSMSAMIIGVATRKAYRHQGLMSGSLSKLCRDLIENERKSLCLFYDNPEAGKIYHNLGFESIDKWTMLFKA